MVNPEHVLCAESKSMSNELVDKLLLVLNSGAPRNCFRLS